VQIQSGRKCAKGASAKTEDGPLAVVTEPEALGNLLRRIDSFEGTFTVLCALCLAPHVLVRPGELRKAEWPNFDLDIGEWRFVTSKTVQEHIVL
jgi:integrase